MKLVTIDDTGTVSLNYPWLPTWLGMNNAFLVKMEKDLAEKVVGMKATEIEAVNEIVLEYICSQFPLAGLREHLESLESVRG